MTDEEEVPMLTRLPARARFTGGVYAAFQCRTCGRETSGLHGDGLQCLDCYQSGRR